MARVHGASSIGLGDHPLRPTRVLLAGIPDLARVIVLDAVGRTSDLQVVGEVSGLEAVAEAGDDADADVVIAGVPEDRLPEVAMRLLTTRCDMTILAIVLSSGDAQLWRMRPTCTRLHDASPDALVEAVRSATSAER